MYDLNMRFFLISLENKIKILIHEAGFEDIKLISKKVDTVENSIVFSYKGTQADAEWSVSTKVDFNNYKNNYDFSKITITGYIWGDDFRIFQEDCNSLKGPYCKLISQLEHEVLSNSLYIDSISSKNKKRI